MSECVRVPPGDGSGDPKKEYVDWPDEDSADDFFISARKPGGVEALDETALFFNLIKRAGTLTQPF